MGHIAAGDKSATIDGLVGNSSGSIVNWDFEKTWMICEGKGYPRLQWERVDCGE